MLSELGAAHVGLTFTEAELTTLYRASGGWPFFAKLLLVSLGEAAAEPDPLPAALDLALRHPAIGEALGHIFRHYFDRGEKTLAVELARRSGELSGRELAALGPDATAAAASLTERFFVEQAPDGACRFRVGLLAPWFRQWSKFAEHAETYRFAG
jgi:hypothetical protein